MRNLNIIAYNLSSLNSGHFRIADEISVTESVRFSEVSLQTIIDLNSEKRSERVRKNVTAEFYVLNLFFDSRNNRRDRP